MESETLGQISVTTVVLTAFFMVFGIYNKPENKQKYKTWLVSVMQGISKIVKRSPAWFIFSILYAGFYLYAIWNYVISLLIDLDLIKWRYYALINRNIFNYYDYHIFIWEFLIIFLTFVLVGLAKIKFEK